MRNLCYGGTFNPIHHGHLICARAAAEAAGFDRVVLLPNQPPHKPDSDELAGAEDRLAMCRLAVAGDAMFEVSDIELRRSHPSYTLETARELKRQGWSEIHWLIGADTVPQLPTWYQPLALLEEVEFVVMARPGWEIDWQGVPPEYRKLRMSVVPAPLIEISASEIRRRVRRRQSISYLTPDAVAAWVRQKRLYL